MIDFEKSNKEIDANAAIEKALSERIPGYTGIPADTGTDGVYQSDLFGYTDTLTRLASERLYHNQNKSRSECRNDVALEFRIFRGKPQNRETGQHVPIIGAHYVSGWQAWLAPRFAQLDTITFFLPNPGIVLHYERYYLEILLSKPETWSEITGMLCKGNDVALVFWHHAVFTRLYVQTVANVTYGAGETGVQFVREPDTDVLYKALS